MAVSRSATPLISLDAAVVDTETTGLDPRSARIVEIAAVRLNGGCLDETSSFRSLVNCGGPIPAAASRIHGIDDGMVSDAPQFAAVWPELSRFIGDTVVIGHSIGFDLAVIRSECKRAGASWQAPLALDTGLLAQVVAPDLAQHSLESLAAWLRVELSGRHSALGDAVTTARIFCALVPKLRDRGIRTLAEATRACERLHGALEDQHRAGWSEAAPVWSLPVPAHARPEAATEPYRRRVGDLMSAPVHSVGAGTRLGDAIRLMADAKIASLFILPGGTVSALPAQTGIITERSIVRALRDLGPAALDTPVDTVMSKPLVTVSADAMAYVAIGRMHRLGIRHLGVTDETGAVAGAISLRDLLRLHAQAGIELGDELAAAGDVHALAKSWTKLTQVVVDLIGNGLSAREIAAVVSQNVIEMTCRAAELAEAAMIESGLGGAPCRYAVVVLGSAGRGESLLAMDQDNALIYAENAPESADAWFERFASRINDILHEAGIPYCKGGVMAKNPAWRGSEGAWRERVARWIGRSAPGDLLAVDIFFDLRLAHGDAAIADRLWHYAFDTARGEVGFAKLLIETVSPSRVRRGWFGGLRTDDGRVDLKSAGLFGIVSTARALAICHHVVERSTPARLSGLIARKLGMESDLEGLLEAQAVFLDLILDQQIDDIKHGRPATNAVEVKRLSRRERSRLETALRSVENLDEIARGLLFRN